MLKQKRGDFVMEILYKSTRGNGETVTASQAILKGLAA